MIVHLELIDAGPGRKKVIIDGVDHSHRVRAVDLSMTHDGVAIANIKMLCTSEGKIFEGTVRALITIDSPPPGSHLIIDETVSGIRTVRVEKDK